MKILFVGAMDREVTLLQEYFSCTVKEKIHDIYPLATSTASDFEVGVLQTHVGDTNAAIATSEAIKIFNPDYVFKIGCVGGNSEGIHSEDIVVPVGFFHSGSWITRSKVDNSPTSDATLWQSVFGEKPYQVNSENLGGHPYIFSPDSSLSKRYKAFLTKEDMHFVESYIGGGNMWFFDLNFMNEVLKTQVPQPKTTRWVADMESYAIAQACYVLKKPFIGFYRVSNSDYYDEPYIPEKVANLFSEDFIKKIELFITELKVNE